MRVKRPMRIGIVSDSHDHVPRLDRAVEFFNEKKVDFVLHGGDYVAMFSAQRLKKLRCDWLGVFGNNDGEIEGLTKVSAGKIKDGPLTLTFLDKKITLLHDIKSIKMNKNDAHIIVSGHTHIPEIKKKGSILFINPGECGGWLTGKSTVAILEVATSTATIHEL